MHEQIAAYVAWAELRGERFYAPWPQACDEEPSRALELRGNQESDTLIVLPPRRSLTPHQRSALAQVLQERGLQPRSLLFVAADQGLALAEFLASRSFSAVFVWDNETLETASIA